MELVIETPRLVLRPFVREDVPAVTEITSRPNVSRHMTEMIYDTPEKAEAWIRMLEGICNIKEPCVVLAIVKKGGRLPIGYIGLHPKDTLDNEVEILYAMTDAYQNKGYVTEAGKALIRWCFDAAPIPFMAAIVQHSNAPSARVAQKLGFVYEGERNLPHNGILTVFRYYRLYA